MLRRLQHFATCLTALLLACGSPAADPASVNPMFERWCKAHPCDWDVRGEARRVGTWHPDDFAVELVGDDAELSQLRAELDHTRSTCFAFSFMANVDAAASAYLELDFLDDGEVEFSQRIPESNWQVRTFTIATPSWYEGVRFSVRKDGPGRVIVAELNVEFARGGCSATPLPLSNRPTGAKCETDEDCASASCKLIELSAVRICD